MVATHDIKDIHFEHDQLNLTIDGRQISIRLEEISPKLLAADEFKRNSYRISPSGYGIHWPLINEDLSIEMLLKRFGC